jgi:hypothetical protein
MNQNYYLNREINILTCLMGFKKESLWLKVKGKYHL